MSDEPQGPGWWLASDGKWYPPNLHPLANVEPAPGLWLAAGGTWDPPNSYSPHGRSPSSASDAELNDPPLGERKDPSSPSLPSRLIKRTKTITLVSGLILLLLVTLATVFATNTGREPLASTSGGQLTSGSTPPSNPSDPPSLAGQPSSDTDGPAASSSLINQSIVQQAFDSTWPKFAEAFATGDRTALFGYADLNVLQAVAGWYECGCAIWPTAYKQVYMSAPPQTSYPLSFFAQIEQKGFDLSPMDVDAVFTKDSSSSPWLVSYLISFNATSEPPGELTMTTIDTEPPPVPFNMPIVGNQLASFFQTAFDTGKPPTTSWPQTGSIAQETNQIIESSHSLSSSELKETVDYVANATSPTFAAPGGDLMCGEIWWQSVITPTNEQPMVQPTDQSKWGEELAPGSYSSITNNGLGDACWFGSTGGVVTPLSFFGGVYSRTGTAS